MIKDQIRKEKNLEEKASTFKKNYNINFLF